MRQKVFREMYSYEQLREIMFYLETENEKASNQGIILANKTYHKSVSFC